MRINVDLATALIKIIFYLNTVSFALANKIHSLPAFLLKLRILFKLLYFTGFVRN